MVARIVPGKSLKTAFFYNENKVKELQARLLSIENYPFQTEDSTPASRLKMLQKQAAISPKVKVNSVHISLNFDPSEDIHKAQYIEIARTYMDRIGFGNQPYLVYQHHDSGHPHIHILTTNVEANGKRISLHHLGKNKSEPARKEIEELFGLVKAEGRNSTRHVKNGAYSEGVVYGRSGSKKAIAEVLATVIGKYRYASIEDLNAVLRGYNVEAYRGKEHTKVFQNNGLLYRILNNSGKPVGVPIKASDFHQKPTLAELQKQFAVNQKLPKTNPNSLKYAIDKYFTNSRAPSIEGLAKSLKRIGIEMIERRSKEGLLYGITYVDHKNRVALNGSEIGKEYSAKGILERCEPVQVENITPRPTLVTANQDAVTEPQASSSHPGSELISGVVDALFQPVQAEEAVPYELSGRKKKRKKKKKRID